MKPVVIVAGGVRVGTVTVHGPVARGTPFDPDDIAAAPVRPHRGTNEGVEIHVTDRRFDFTPLQRLAQVARVAGAARVELARFEGSMPERWPQVERIYSAVVARPTAEWATVLTDLCGGDASLRQELESLLAHEHAAQSFLETPGFAGADVAGHLAGEPTLVGRQLGSYTVLAPLGSGGMGEVYRARDELLGREVAIKLLPSHFANDPDRRARLESEARMLAALNHPHIGGDLRPRGPWTAVPRWCSSSSKARRWPSLSQEGPCRWPRHSPSRDRSRTRSKPRMAAASSTAT